ncbi:MAG TPA: Uma2 family endonuclease [Gemmataceae bacterium]|jgi:Uma2 family endonuclease|nr:Uma2 family endonuclease [Gemmataceae bacterium]
MSTVSLDKKLRLGPELAGISLAPEEFDAVEECDENYFYELINGVLVVTPPPLESERDPNEELGHWLRTYREQHPQGLILDKTLPEQIVATRNNRRRADRVIWVGLGRVPDPEIDPPSIVVEFVSAAKRDWQRDFVEKKGEYMQIRVSEYWIVDRFRRQMTVYRPRKREVIIGENETYRTPLLPGFELPLARLFAVADSWKKE